MAGPLIDHRTIAKEFVRHFCAGDFNNLAPLLSPDLHLIGPLFDFDSAMDYLDALKNGPPVQCGYRLLSVTEDADSVSVFYEYEKPESTVTIAQLFRFRAQLISEILLVFDGRGFG